MSALPDSPATRAEQFAFLQAAYTGPLTWKGLCQSLARQAPRLPAVYPSALAAALATPEAYRVPKIGGLRRGMVAFFDDPNDGNPYGHVVTVAGWDGPKTTLANLLVWSNDAARTGGVDLVRGDFFPQHWGDSFQFGATCLNGYDLPGYGRSTDTAVPHPGRATIGANLDHAITDLRGAIRHHRSKGHSAIVNALVVDLRELKETRKKFPA